METNGSIFRHIVNSDMPESEKADERLASEAQVLLGGGTTSSARTLSFVSFYVLSKPAVHDRLQQELKDVMANYPEVVPSLVDLEKLQYLQALIKEALR